MMHLNKHQCLPVEIYEVSCQCGKVFYEFAGHPLLSCPYCTKLFAKASLRSYTVYLDINHKTSQLRVVHPKPVDPRHVKLQHVVMKWINEHLDLLGFVKDKVQSYRQLREWPLESFSRELQEKAEQAANGEPNSSAKEVLVASLAIVDWLEIAYAYMHTELVN